MQKNKNCKFFLGNTENMNMMIMIESVATWIAFDFIPFNKMICLQSTKSDKLAFNTQRGS